MGKTILIVDDEPVVLEVATAILQHAGYQVKTAQNGEMAVELCRDAERPIDLLLTDVDMPRVNGAELAECLANRKRGFPVMFMRGDGIDSAPKKALTSQRGMDGSATVEKPFTKRQLLSAVETLLERSDADRAQIEKRSAALNGKAPFGRGVGHIVVQLRNQLHDGSGV